MRPPILQSKSNLLQRLIHGGDLEKSEMINKFLRMTNNVD